MKRSASLAARIALPMLFAMLAGPLVAAETSAPQPLDIETIEDFSVYEKAIIHQLDNSNTYEEITPEQRSRALTLMTEIKAIIDRSGSIATLPPLPRVDVFNRQEELNQILAQAEEDSRVICRRERPTGSKLPINKCMTLAERRKTREGGKQYLREIIPAEGPLDQSGM
ncbi:hypothetical protein [Novilysobacter avium]|uniref:Secreted protein n=2 Tax=Lysobacteraceae TaxID=32033 RepID=A0A7S6ZUZ6_9GAMM|nr:hypothetical protein [Lysobacter avium]QOW22667.1 hypothetical protein INQ42_03505 [Lysobacter avium]